MNGSRQQCPACGTDFSEVQKVLRQGESLVYCLQCKFPLLRIAGKYELEKVLGQGGCGIVYLARHIHLQHDPERVIKIIKPEVFAIEGMAQRFHREVQLTSALSQRNEHIVRIYDDFGSIPELGHFYVMEYLQGLSLTELREESDTLPDVALCFRIFEQLCETMHSAHLAGVVHRDLKPDNLFLVQREENPSFLKVLDFGIARPINEKELRVTNLTQGALGTPAYMAPEQCLNQSIDARSDLYAMGVILYELLTGKTPFLRDSDSAPEVSLVELLRHQVTTPPPSPRSLRPDRVSPDVEDLLFRLLAKKQEDRFQSAAELRETLQQIDCMPSPSSAETLSYGTALSLQEGLLETCPYPDAPSPLSQKLTPAPAEEKGTSSSAGRKETSAPVGRKDSPLSLADATQKLVSTSSQTIEASPPEGADGQETLLSEPEEQGVPLSEPEEQGVSPDKAAPQQATPSSSLPTLPDEDGATVDWRETGLTNGSSCLPTLPGDDSPFPQEKEEKSSSSPEEEEPLASGGFRRPLWFALAALLGLSLVAVFVAPRLFSSPSKAPHSSFPSSEAGPPPRGVLQGKAAPSQGAPPSSPEARPSQASTPSVTPSWKRGDRPSPRPSLTPAVSPSAHHSSPRRGAAPDKGQRRREASRNAPRRSSLRGAPSNAARRIASRTAPLSPRRRSGKQRPIHKASRRKKRSPRHPRPRRPRRSHRRASPKGCPPARRGVRWVLLRLRPSHINARAVFLQGKGRSRTGPDGLCIQLYRASQLQIEAAGYRPCAFSLPFRHASLQVTLKKEALDDIEVDDAYCLQK